MGETSVQNDWKRRENTYSVGSLAWSIVSSSSDTRASRCLEDIDGFLCATHVTTFSDEFCSLGDECGGFRTGDLVLGSTREGNVNLFNQRPGASAFVVFESGGKGGSSRKLGEVTTTDFEVLDGGDILGSETLAVGGEKGALRVGEGNDDGTEFDGLDDRSE